MTQRREPQNAIHLKILAKERSDPEQIEGDAHTCEQRCEVWLQELPFHIMGFLSGSVIKNLPANAGDAGSISGSGRCPGGGNGNPFQYFCLENSMGNGVWRTIVHRVEKSQARLSD